MNKTPEVGKCGIANAVASRPRNDIPISFFNQATNPSIEGRVLQEGVSSMMTPNPSIDAMPKRLRLLGIAHVKR
jgi:hypothetical protein